jgi:hypothetical protein
MPSQEFVELKEMIEGLGLKVDSMTASLKKCQSHCYVDNPTPKRRWSLLRAITALVKF